MSKRYAAVAITRCGIELAVKLGAQLGGTEVFVYAKYSGGLEARSGEITVFDGPVRGLLPKLFWSYEAVILFFSLGAAVRLTAPLLRDKRSDPAVIVIDERGEHVISMLSGHLGGANRLTLEIAGLLGSHPVITTASDVQGTFAVDLLGREYGWHADSFTPMKGLVLRSLTGSRWLLCRRAENVTGCRRVLKCRSMSLCSQAGLSFGIADAASAQRLW